MTSVLENVRQYAIEQIKKGPLSTKEQEQIFDAIAEVILLWHIARDEGLLSLEVAVEDQNKKMSYESLLKKAVLLICDGREPELVEEILTTYYWMDTSDRVTAIVGYLYIRGILLIQKGENPYLIREILYAMIPCDYKEACEKWVDGIIKNYEDAKQAKEIENYHKISFLPSNQQVVTYSEKLEQNLLTMSDKDIQVLLRNIENDYLTTAMLALSKDAKDILFANMSKRLATMLMIDITHKVRCVNGKYYADENDIKEALEKILQTIELLDFAGEFTGENLS